MRIGPDQLILWQHGFVKLNATIVTTWGLMLLLTIGASLITRKLTSDVIVLALAGRARDSHHRHR
jgi:F-type H+-transporting ATPase subunit a